MKCTSVAVNKMGSGSLRSVGNECRGRSEKYSRLIYRALKQGPREQSVSLSKTSDLILSIAAEAARLSLYNKRRTITRREVVSAVKTIAGSQCSARSSPGCAATD